MAETYGLKSPQPIMCSSPDSQMWIFQSGSKYYIWCPIEDIVLEIMISMDLVNIVTKIAKLGLRSLKTKQIHEV